MWVHTGRVWVDNPIPVFHHGAPTACHPVPIGMVPNGYYQDTGYSTTPQSWTSGRPTNEEGCDACAQTVQAASAATGRSQRARERADRHLEEVRRGAAADMASALDAEIGRYADAEIEHEECDRRSAELDAEVAEQDRRWRASRSPAGKPPPAVARPAPRRPEPVRSEAVARARAAAAEERRHQAPVNENRKRYGSDRALIDRHRRLRGVSESVRPALHPLLLAALVAAGVAGSIELQGAQDWVPPMIDALGYSEEVRDRASVPAGAVIGVLAYVLASGLFSAAHRLRARRAWRAAEVIRGRVGCGGLSCSRCKRPDGFALPRRRAAGSRVAGWMVLGAVAFAIHAGITLGDPVVKLNRVSAAVPERIKADCRQRTEELDTIELICAGPRVSEVGLERAYFQFGNPSYDTYGDGVFDDSYAFADCVEWWSYSDRAGGFSDCASGAAMWTDEAVVLGGAVGSRAAEFARVQHRYGGQRSYWP